MTKARSLGRSTPLLRSRRLARSILLATVAVAAFATLPACAPIHRARWGGWEAWDPGVEIRFPACGANDQCTANSNDDGSDIAMVAAAAAPMPPAPRLARAAAVVGIFAYDQVFSIFSRPITGVNAGADTKFTLIPGTYAFEYETGDFDPVYGEINVFPVSSPRAHDFIAHSSILLTPSPEGRKTVLSESNLSRARNGEVVTKVVFMAHLPAIRDRLNDIERGQGELDRLRDTLMEQKDFWERKLADRRLNTRYSADFGWGVDVPAADLALLQTIVGPERYHWRRFSQAGAKVRKYEQKLVDLETAERNLAEERDALKQLLYSVEVLHRTDELMVLTPSMIRPYHDPVYEVHKLRGGGVWADNYRGKLPLDGDDWIGPLGKIHFPYLASALSMGSLSPGLRAVVAPSPAVSKNIGEVLMVVTLGSRKPPELGGSASWRRAK